MKSPNSQSADLPSVDPWDEPDLAALDRTVPLEFAGKLAPNYYCRGWNSPRKKYCRNRAGYRTDHHGRGRCYYHSGTKQVFAPAPPRLIDLVPRNMRPSFSIHISKLVKAVVDDPAIAAQLHRGIVTVPCPFSLAIEPKPD